MRLVICQPLPGKQERGECTDSPLLLRDIITCLKIDYVLIFVCEIGEDIIVQIEDIETPSKIINVFLLWFVQLKIVTEDSYSKRQK